MSAARVMERGDIAAAGPEVTSRDRLIRFDEDIFRQNFNRLHFPVTHSLCDDPLFELPRLIELARRLPEENIEYNAGNISIIQDPNLTPRNGLSIEETIRRIEECNSWMVMKYVEDDPCYRELLDKCLDQLRQFTEPTDPGMCRREAFIFISSPGAVTPCHIDPEYNFLLQIRGKKFMTVFDPQDREVISEEQLEEYLSGNHRNLRMTEEQVLSGVTYELDPGMGVHVPVTAPHYVKVGDRVSISFSVTFRTPGSDRRSIVYSVNSYLRGIGLKPTPYGQSRIRDAIKFNSFRALRRARRIAERLRGR